MTSVLDTRPERTMASALTRDLDVLAGKQLMELLLERRDRLLDDQVVLHALRRRPRRSG